MNEIGIFSWFGHELPLAQRLALIAEPGFHWTCLWLAHEEELVAISHDLLHVTDKTCHRLLEDRWIRHIRISDHRDRGGLKIGIDSFPGPSGDWSIDIWITGQPETAGFGLVEKLQKELMPQHREPILTIKRAYHADGRLNDGLSTRIYERVIQHGISTVEQLRHFLAMEEQI